MSIKTNVGRRPAKYLYHSLSENRDDDGRVWSRDGFLETSIGTARVYSYEHRDGRQDINADFIYDGERHTFFQRRTRPHALTRRGILIVVGRWLRQLEAELA